MEIIRTSNCIHEHASSPHLPELGRRSRSCVPDWNFSRDPAGPRKIKLGLIGCGWYGLVDAKAALKTGGTEVIGVCDVDGEHLSKTVEELENEARKYLQEGHAEPIICADAQIHYTAGTPDPTPQPPPASLDWDL